MEKRKVPVDLDDVASVFVDIPLDMTHYLDPETGEVGLVSEDALYALRAIYDELSPEEQDDPAAVDAAIERGKVPDWQKPELRLAEAVDGDAAGRFLAIPRQETRDSYQDMADFVETVDDERLRQVNPCQTQPARLQVRRQRGDIKIELGEERDERHRPRGGPGTRPRR